MYAIIETGGKQYRVEKGRSLRVEKLPGAEGETIIFDRVLLLGHDDGVQFGRPYLEGCTVHGKVLCQGRGKKIIVFKYRAKKNYRRKRGHRQPFTEVLVEKIVMPREVEADGA